MRLDLSADGRLLACGGLDWPIQLWEVAGATPQLQRVVENRRGVSLALSPTGSWLAADDGAAGLQLWKLDTTKEAVAQTFKALQFGYVAFSRDGSVLASTFAAGNFVVWNMRGSAPKEKTVYDMAATTYSYPPALSTDGSLLAAHCGNGEVRLYDVSQSDPKNLPHLKHDSTVYSLAFSPRRLLACGSAGWIQLWDLDGTEAKKQARWSINSPGYSQVFSVAFSPDGDRLASAHHDGQLIVWDLATEKQVWQRQLPGEIHKVLFAPDGRHLVTLNGNGTIYIFRLEGPRPPLQNAG